MVNFRLCADLVVVVGIFDIVVDGIVGTVVVAIVETVVDVNPSDVVDGNVIFEQLRAAPPGIFSF